MALEQKRGNGAEYVDTDGRHGDCDEMVAQPTMRGGRRTDNVTNLAGGRPEYAQHRSIVPTTPDVHALTWDVCPRGSRPMIVGQ